MNVQHIISEALVQYDAAQPVIRYLLKNARQEGIKSTNDIERTKIKFIDKNTDEVLVDTEVEILAIFYDKFNVWSWAWAHTGLTNAENYLSKEILLYALKLESDLSYLKSILTRSRGEIKDITQIDINLAIGSFVIKKPYIFPYIYTIDNDNLVYYLILINNDDLDRLKDKIKNNPNDNFEMD